MLKLLNIANGAMIETQRVVQSLQPDVRPHIVCRSQTFSAQGVIACSISARAETVWGLDRQGLVQWITTGLVGVKWP